MVSFNEDEEWLFDDSEFDRLPLSFDEFLARADAIDQVFRDRELDDFDVIRALPLNTRPRNVVFAFLRNLCLGEEEGLCANSTSFHDVVHPRLIKIVSEALPGEHSLVSTIGTKLSRVLFDSDFIDFMPLERLKALQESVEADRRLLANATDIVAALQESINLCYGEVAARTTIENIHFARSFLRNPAKNPAFLDVGAGRGRPLLAACYFLNFERCVGIDIEPERVSRSSKMWNAFIERENIDHGEEEEVLRRMSISLADATLDETYEEIIAPSDQIDIAFTYSVCYSEKLRGQIAEKLEKHLHPGAVLITRDLNNEAWVRENFQQIYFNGSTGTFFFQKMK